MAKQEQNSQAETLERGEIYFLYRPAVGEEEVKGLEDVQRFFLLLHPEGSRNHRLIIIGKKKLPEAGRSGERYWGFVEDVMATDKQLQEAFSPESYETKTRGDRMVASMRLAGSGEYQLIRHGNHTHLVYELTLPERRSEVQRDLNIEREASYIISIKNPNASTPRGAGLENDQKAELPQRLQDLFKGRRFINADPPELLDYKGVEILLISTDESLGELGIDLEAEDRAAEKDAAEVFKALHMRQSAEKERPLLRGLWQ
jgi:hypothetical protein